MRAICLSLPALVLAACALPPDTPSDPLLAEGHAIARQHCASCHAIGVDDRSRHREAPPLRTLSENYPVSALEESLAEGIMVGHPDMPEFMMGPSAIRALIAYLESIQAQ